MAHVPEAGSGKGRNIELNIVPFIDLMSCLTAFLLVAAVWVNTARLEVESAGRADRGPPCDDDECGVKLSVLLESDDIWIGVSRLNEFQRLPRRADGTYDYDGLERSLRAHKTSSLFSGSTAIEIAAASTPSTPIAYQALVSTMDIAVRAGFIDVGLSDPAGLTARPQL